MYGELVSFRTRSWSPSNQNLRFFFFRLGYNRHCWGASWFRLVFQKLFLTLYEARPPTISSKFVLSISLLECAQFESPKTSFIESRIKKLKRDFAVCLNMYVLLYGPPVITYIILMIPYSLISIKRIYNSSNFPVIKFWLQTVPLMSKTGWTRQKV